MCFYKEVIFSFPRNLSVALVLEHLKQIWRDLFKKKGKGDHPLCPATPITHLQLHSEEKDSVR